MAAPAVVTARPLAVTVAVEDESLRSVSSASFGRMRPVRGNFRALNLPDGEPPSRWAWARACCRAMSLAMPMKRDTSFRGDSSGPPSAADDGDDARVEEDNFCANRATSCSSDPKFPERDGVVLSGLCIAFCIAHVSEGEVRSRRGSLGGVEKAPPGGGPPVGVGVVVRW